MTLEVEKSNDAWGNCMATFSRSYSKSKFNLASQPALHTHRGGWMNVLKAMTPLHNNDGVRCETFIECPFDWFRNKNIKNGSIPIKEPWVGFIHNPHNMPSWYDNENSVRVENDLFFKMSLPSCKGLYAMSEYHAKGLRNLFRGLKCESILHPYSDEEVPQWKGNVKNLVAVGWWLRKQSSIYECEVPKGYQKIKLWAYEKDSLPHQMVKEKLIKEAEILGIKLKRIKELFRLSNAKYDELLSESIVLLDLWDTSANNTILECIQRGVPIIVKDHPAVREYLGDDYPLYFQNVNQVYGLVYKAQEAHEYLCKLQNSNKFTLKSFVSNIRKSEIYKQL